jgi:hypothetical protein
LPTNGKKKTPEALIYWTPGIFSEPEMGLTKAPMTALYGTFTAFFSCE